MATTKTAKPKVTKVPAKHRLTYATCGEWVTANAKHPAAKGRLADCGRLARHKGECRATLSAPKVRVARKSRAKVSATPKFTTMKAVQTYRDTLREALAAGTMSADDVLSAWAKADDSYAAYLRAKRSAKRTAKPAAEAVA